MNLKDNLNKMLELNSKLEKSLLLEKLWPKIFDFGGCKTQQHGTSHKQSFIIIRGDGETKTFPLSRKNSIRGTIWSSENKIVDELIRYETLYRERGN